jgi:tetratricopeptide (TPR) repeat protein
MKSANKSRIPKTAIKFAPLWTALLSAVLAVTPIFAAARAQLDEGIQAYAREDFKAAVKLLEQAVEARPNDATAHLWLGRAYGRRAERANWFSALGLAKKTVRSFERAVELDGDNREALEDLLDYYTSAPGIVGGGLDKAEAIAGRIAKLNAAAGERAWAAILKQREKYAEAEKRLEKAIKLEPENVGHVLSLAAFKAQRGWYEASDELYTKALRMAPDSPEVWFSRAKELVRAGRRPDEARELLKKYLAADLKPSAEPKSEARKLLGKAG